MKYYPDKAIPPGPTLAADMTDTESTITSKHAPTGTDLLEKDAAVAFDAAGAGH
jgi:hypothetical protein